MTIIQVFNGYCTPTIYDVVVDTDKGCFTVANDDRIYSIPKLVERLTDEEKQEILEAAKAYRASK